MLPKVFISLESPWTGIVIPKDNGSGNDVT